MNEAMQRTGRRNRQDALVFVLKSQFNGGDGTLKALALAAEKALIEDQHFRDLKRLTTENKRWQERCKTLHLKLLAATSRGPKGELQRRLAEVDWDHVLRKEQADMQRGLQL